MSQLLLGIDVGTQGSKAVVLDEALQVAASEYEPNTISTPAPGHVEQDAEEVWWQGVCRMLQRLTATAGVQPERVSGLGVTALFPEMLPLDKEGVPLRPAMLYGIDTRAQAQIRTLTDALGEDYILEHSKTLLTSQSVGPKLLWFRENEPERFGHTSCVLSASSYIVYRLTGRLVIDTTTAAFFAPFYEYAHATWNTEVMRQFGLGATLFPPVVSPQEVVGHVTPRAAAETGLAQGTPVVAGSGDGVGEMLSQGVGRPGEMSIMYGTFGASYVVTETPATNRDMWVFPYLGGLHCLGGGIAATGAVTKWFVEQLCGPGAGVGHRPGEAGTRGAAGSASSAGLRENAEQPPNVGFAQYEQLAHQAAEIPRGAGGLMVLPFFKGEQPPYNDPQARALLMGLTTHHDYRHVYRALLEGTGYSFRYIIEQIEAAGFPVGDITSSGGGTKNPTWIEIVSDITGRRQHIPHSDGAPAGAAYLAGLGTGRFQSLDDIRAHVKIERTYRPDPDHGSWYDRYYRMFEGLRRATQPFMHELSEMS